MTMWMFLTSRSLQPIIIVLHDKELTHKTKVFLGLVIEERRVKVKTSTGASVNQQQ